MLAVNMHSGLMTALGSSMRLYAKGVATRASPSTLRKTTQLKNLINSKELEFLMEAHNGISARIAQDAGFKGIWGSGLTLSASLGVRDSNEASWSQVLDATEFMADASDVPILLDGDTGHGNFNNARRLVTKLETRGIAGVCFEDKLFPKTNSFISAHGGHPLADPQEHALKVKACKDAQKDPDFCVVARVEALIAGWSMDEAIMRAKLYADAGADAILIHSKKADSSEIDTFMKRWDHRKPIIIVPTKYYKEIGISTIIWANHSLRASVTAMENVCKEIYTKQSIAEVEKKVATVDDLFHYQNDKELRDAEDKYLPTGK